MWKRIPEVQGHGEVINVPGNISHTALLQGKEPAWLRESIPERLWQHEKSIALVTGRLDGPNPTHQVFMLTQPSNLEVAGTCQGTNFMSEGSCLSVADALHECIR